MRHFLLVSLLGATALPVFAAGQGQTPMTPQRPHSVVGDLRVISKFHSQVLNNDRDLFIWLPPEYEKEPNHRYPVLYMADGQNLFNLETSYLPDQEWRVDEIATSLIESKLIEPVIIVGVANAGVDRGNEYLPTKVKETGGRADLYGRFMVEEVKPFIDRTYRTRLRAKDTGLAGSSFGGVITMYLGTKYPNVFGKLAVVSPSVWWDDKVLLTYIDKLPRRTGQRIWVDIGTQEGPNAEADAVSLRDHLVAKGWTLGRDLAFFRDFGAHHKENAWAGRMDSILLFLFGR